MSTATYRTTEKKCATCRWWQGARGIEMRNYQPSYECESAIKRI